MDKMHNVNPENSKGITPFHHFAKNGLLDLCQRIITKLSDNNPKDKQGNTPLHLAAESGHVGVCELVIGNIDSVNPKNDEEMTPLHKAAKSGHLKICNLLLMKFNQANPRDIFSKTPLQYAAENGHLHTCKFLIQRTANVTFKDNDHLTIQSAFKRRHSDVGKLLLKQISDTKGKSCVLQTVMKGDILETMIKDLNQCQILFESLGITHFIDVLQFLHYVHLKVPNFLKLFINKAEVLIDQQGWKLLHHAVRLGDLRLCKLVIDNTDDKNPRGKLGLTPYHCAAWIGNLEICELIAKQIRFQPLKAKLLFDHFGRSPLYYAERNGFAELAFLMVQDNMHGMYAEGKKTEHPQFLRCLMFLSYQFYQYDCFFQDQQRDGTGW
jgi:ankyrin repeat protein